MGKVNWPTVYEYGVRGLAEFCGNAIVLSLGCIGAVSTEIYSNTPIQLGFCFGLIVMAVYNTFWIISGAHITPPITIAALIVKKINWIDALIYIPCQFLGGIFGFYLAALLIPQTAHVSSFTHQKVCLTVPNYAIGMTRVQALLIEFVTTSAWVFVMLAVWSRPEGTVKDNSALQVGFSVVALTMLSAESTGASMSPARTLPPAIYFGVFEDIWVYFVGPMAASIIAAVAWRYIFTEENLKKWIGKSHFIQPKNILS